jgi:AraC-like DNA-binding protein
VAEPTVSAGLADGLARFAAGKGADRGTMLVLAGVTEAELADHDHRIGLACYIALTRAAIALTGDPAFALHFGEQVDLADISIVGLIGQASRTMPEALAQLNRYGRLVIDVDIGTAPRFSNEIDVTGIWMTDHRDSPNAFPELTEATFARMICGVRRFAPQLRVHAVEVTHAAPSHAAEYERLLGAPVQFGAARNAYRIDREWLTISLQLQPAYAFGILSKHAEALLESLEASCTLKSRVEALIMPILHTGEAGVNRIAAEMGMSRQTLYRKLSSEGTSFAALLDTLRHRLALHYLGGHKVSVNQTAYLVGFSDPAAFSRAFKRWTGRSPKEVRRD